MDTTIITQLHTHPVHTDPVDEALGIVLGSGLSAELVCDGSCEGLSSCAVAPVDHLQAA